MKCIKSTLKKLKDFVIKYWKHFTIDGVSLILLVVAITFDGIYRTELNDYLALLSTDSLLSIVSIVASVVLPANQTKMIEKYNISEDEYKEFKGNTDKDYLNIMAVSIILLFLDAFLYAFKLPISLLVSFSILAFLACYMLIPRFREWIRKDKGLYELVNKKLGSIVKSNDRWESNLIKNKNNDQIVINKVVTYLLLNNGYDNTIKALFYTEEPEVQNQFNSDNLVIYFSHLLHYVILEYEKDNNQFGELDNQKIIQYIDAITTILNHYEEIDFENDDNKKRDFPFLEIVESVCAISKIASDDKYKTALESFYDFIIRLVQASNQESLQTFYYTLLDTLLAYTIDEGNVLFIEAMFRCYKRGYLGTHRSFSDYFVFFMFYLIFLLCHDEYLIHISDSDKSKIKQTTSVYFSEFIKTLRRDFDCESFVQLRQSLISHEQHYNNFERNIMRKNSISTIISDMNKNLNIICYNYPVFFTILFCANEGISIDDILIQADDQIFSSFDGVLLRESLDKNKNIYLFNETLNKLNVFSKKFSTKDLDGGLDYVRSFRIRRGHMIEVEKSTKFNEMINLMDDYYKSLTAYNESPENFVEETTYHGVKTKDSTYYVVINGFAPIEEILDVEPLSFANSQFDHLTDILYHHCHLISDYDKDIVKEINSFKPLIKYSPNFDKYIKETPLVKCPNIKKASDDYNYLFNYSPDYDAFFQDKAIAFNCWFVRKQCYIRRVDPVELDSLVKRFFRKSGDKYCYKNNRREERISRTTYTLEEAQNFVLSCIYIVKIVTRLDYAFNDKKMLIYKIVKEGNK